MTHTELVYWSKSGRDATLAILDKLLKKPGWAATVSSLRIRVIEDHDDPTHEFPFPVLILALRNMQALSSIAIEGMIFKSAADQADFIITLQTYNPRLEELRWYNSTTFPSPEFSLAGLKVLQWSESGNIRGMGPHAENYEPALPSILDASKNTLQEIIIPLRIECDMGDHCVWDYLFPNLHTLRVRAQQDLKDKWPKKAMDFVDNHISTLRHISLDLDEHCEPRIGESTCHLSIWPGSAEAPYSLNKFAGDLDIIGSSSILGQYFRFNNLEDVTLLAGYDKGGYGPDPITQLIDFSEGCTRENACVSLHRLRSLGFELMFNQGEVWNVHGELIGDWPDDDEVEEAETADSNPGRMFELLDAYGKICGKTVENLSVVISLHPGSPNPFPVVELVASLRLFTELKMLTLPDFAPEGKQGDQVAIRLYILVLARDLPKLVAVKLVHPDRKTHLYKISRPVIQVSGPLDNPPQLFLRGRDKIIEPSLFQY